MADPYLGNYQGVDADAPYLTEHQRAALHDYQRQHQPGLWSTLRQQLHNANEQTGLLLQRVRGDHRNYEPLEPFASALRHPRVRQVLALTAAALGIVLLVNLFSHGGGGGHGRRPRGGGGDLSEVPKSLRPLPITRQRACRIDIESAAPPPAGNRYIQIFNRCSGETVYPGMIGQGGGAVPGPPEGWRLDPGDCKTITVPSIFPSIRIWGRTGCNNATTPGEFKCQTGNCVVNGDLNCVSAASVASLYEATLQGACPAKGAQAPGQGPDFYDASTVDGYNIPLTVELVGGSDVPNTPKSMSCINPVVYPMTVDDCPFELRRYSDQLPGWDVPLASVAGKNVEVSPCYRRPLDKDCRKKFNGCNSICKAWDEGWISYYIDSVTGPADKVDPYIKLLGPSGKRIRWSEQFLQGRQNCSSDGCRMQKAFGAYRGAVYGEQGHTMKDLVCCAGTFFCSPFQPNDSPGCSFTAACPTLGAGDKQNSRFYPRLYGKDLDYPQEDQEVRMSSPLPDWPLSTNGLGYSEVYKRVNPSAYSWQYDDGANSLFLCCGDKDDEGQSTGPHYIITFCGV